MSCADNIDKNMKYKEEILTPSYISEYKVPKAILIRLLHSKLTIL